MAELNPFAYVDAVSASKIDIVRGADNEIQRSLMEKGINPFMMNKAFSYHPHTILYAN